LDYPISNLYQILLKNAHPVGVPNLLGAFSTTKRRGGGDNPNKLGTPALPGGNPSHNATFFNRALSRGKVMATIQGVYITMLGMAILFVALLILMLVAMGLERLFRPKELSKETPVKGEKELVAAIAVAIALNLKPRTSNLKPQTSNVKRHKDTPGAWRFWGRHRQLMRSQGVRGARR
jgi:Na+-transporting methylmalonyl-CoA/oxaloacetate decarboxylase gamma subunit